MAKPLSDMSERELESAYNKESDEGSKLNSQMISEGRGQERPSETRTKNDALSNKMKDHLDRMGKIVDERNARMRYHGNYRPIKKHRF